MTRLKIKQNIEPCCAKSIFYCFLLFNFIFYLLHLRNISASFSSSSSSSSSLYTAFHWQFTDLQRNKIQHNRVLVLLWHHPKSATNCGINKILKCFTVICLNKKVKVWPYNLNYSNLVTQSVNWAMRTQLVEKILHRYIAITLICSGFGEVDWESRKLDLKLISLATSLSTIF